MDVDSAVINEVYRDVELRVWVYNRLADNEMMKFADPEIKQKDIAFALLYKSGYDEEKDTVEFIKTVKVNSGKEQGTIYFFKRKSENKRNWMVDYVGLLPTDKSNFNSDGHSMKKGLSIKNDTELEETIQHTIEIFELTDRKRVVLDTYDYGSLFDGFY